MKTLLIAGCRQMFIETAFNIALRKLSTIFSPNGITIFWFTTGY